MSSKKRIENKISRTAEYTCMNRAASYLEKDIHYKTDDYISVKLIPKFLRFLLKYKILNLKGRLSPKGIYEYVIARTKYIDNVFQNALDNGFEQILIFGAGFDSRAIRYLNPEMNTIVFELDAFITQQAKIKQLKERKIITPKNNIYISIDFNKEAVEKKLLENNFSKHKKTLFVLEGLTMYLNKEAIDKTFNLIHEFSSSGSLVVFDYIYASVLNQENRYYGEKEIYQKVKNANEEWTFGIEEGQIDLFLNSRKFKLLEHLDSNSIENKYFNNATGKITVKVNGTHCIVLAERV